MKTCDVESRLEMECIIFCEMKSRWENKVKRLNTEISILQQAKSSRCPSREEDSLLIGRLEKEVSQKTAVLEKALQDMAYIKRELINREENYNKKFNNSTPIVGIGTMRTGNRVSQSQPSDRSVLPVSGRATGRVLSSQGRRRGSQWKW